MDTDDLSKETYQAVLITAEKFNHNLCIQFGILASDCRDDDDYLTNASQLIKEWKSNLENSIDDIFFDTVRPKPMVFKALLSTIQDKIENVKNIPLDKRNFDF